MQGLPLNAIQRDLAAGKTIVLDGGTGTELERRGATMHAEAWCAMATLNSPDILRAVHEDYIRAGARVITANTFSTGRNMLGPAGLGAHFEALNRQAVEIALEARDRMGANHSVAVAGSVSHQVPVASGTDQRDPDRVPSPESIAANQQELATLLCESGVDFLLLEMMSDPVLANPTIAAALAAQLPVWVGYSCREDKGGMTVSYAVDGLGLDDMLDAIPAAGASVAGVMHTNPGLIKEAVKAIRKAYDGPVMAYPDSGYFKMPNWQWIDVITPQDFAAAALTWVDEGAQIIGGCCGLGVDHIDALANALARQ